MRPRPRRFSVWLSDVPGGSRNTDRRAHRQTTAANYRAEGIYVIAPSPVKDTRPGDAGKWLSLIASSISYFISGALLRRPSLAPHMEPRGVIGQRCVLGSSGS